LRALVIAASHSEDKSFEDGLKRYLDKLARHTTPSGGPVGDEWVFEREGDPTDTGYEYCSVHELVHSYLSLLSTTGDLAWADKAETLFYNAGLGGRSLEHKGIAYLNVDNAYYMEGINPNDSAKKDPFCARTDKANSEADNQTRYKYSPVHQDVAVCCSPNAGRLFPYFVSGMWYMEGETLVKSLYGPSVLSFESGHGQVQIKELTSYPYDNQVEFIFSCEGVCPLTIKLRKPAFVDGMEVTGNFKSVEETDKYILVTGEWSQGDRLGLKFDFSLKKNLDNRGDIYFTYGPLVMALPIEMRETVVKEWALEGFADYHFSPKNDLHMRSFLEEGAGLNLKIRRDVEPSYRLDVDMLISSKQLEVEENAQTVTSSLIQDIGYERQRLTLVPMGETILRRISFREVQI